MFIIVKLDFTKDQIPIISKINTLINNINNEKLKINEFKILIFNYK